MNDFFFILLIIILLYLFSKKKNIYREEWKVSKKSNSKKLKITNSLIIIWDRYCKNEFLNDNNIDYCSLKNINTKLGEVYQTPNNFVLLMQLHPKQFNNINDFFKMLHDFIKTFKENYHIENLINISTCGTSPKNNIKIGSIHQINKCIIFGYPEYKFNTKRIHGNKIYMKTPVYKKNNIVQITKKFVSKNIDKTIFSKNEIVFYGEDSFIILILGNQLNLKTLCLVGVTDTQSWKQYPIHGDKTGKQLIKYIFY